MLPHLGSSLKALSKISALPRSLLVIIDFKLGKRALKKAGAFVPICEISGTFGYSTPSSSS